MNHSDNDLNTRSLLSLIFGLLAIGGMCPCVGSIAAILLGMGERNVAGRAGFHLGWISLVMAFFAVFVMILVLGTAGLIEAFN